MGEGRGGRCVGRREGFVGTDEGMTYFREAGFVLFLGLEWQEVRRKERAHGRFIFHFFHLWMF